MSGKVYDCPSCGEMVIPKRNKTLVILLLVTVVAWPAVFFLKKRCPTCKTVIPR